MTAQEEFNKMYVTSREIGERLNVTRSAIIHARQKGMLPNAIMIDNHLVIWRRNEIEPFVAAWKQRRDERLGVA